MTGMHRRAWLVIAMAFMMLPWTASAQATEQNDQTKARQQGQRRLAILAQRLNLTDEQKQQWIQINRETGQKVRAARHDDSLSEDQMQAQLKEIHKQHNQQLFAVLTPEQQAQLKAFWEEQKQKQQQGKPSDTDNSNSGSSTQNGDASKEKDDDLFAGMVSDDPVPPPPPQTKKAAPK